MATTTNDKPLRLGDLPVVKTNILENARQFDKGVVGGYNGIFPLTAASQGGIYLLPSTGKFYVCETAYNGTQISAPNSNFVELSVWKNHDRLSNLPKIIEYGEHAISTVTDEGYTFNFKNNFTKIIGIIVCLKKNYTAKSLENVYLKSFNNSNFTVIYDCVNAIDAKGGTVSYIAIGY